MGTMLIVTRQMRAHHAGHGDEIVLQVVLELGEVICGSDRRRVSSTNTTDVLQRVFIVEHQRQQLSINNQSVESDR